MILSYASDPHRHHSNHGKPKYPSRNSPPPSSLVKKSLDPHMKKILYVTFSPGFEFYWSLFARHLAFFHCMTVGFASVGRVYNLTQSDSSEKRNPVGFFYYTRTIISSPITILQKKWRTNDNKRAWRMLT